MKHTFSKIVSGISLSILVVLAALGSVASANAAPSRPNIVFILADDLGWRDTSLYGSTYYETPNIDALAKRGMMFNNAYSASPLCSPSRAGIMTGLWPARIGITRPSCHMEEVILEKDVKSHARPDNKSIDARTLTRLKLEYFTLAKGLKSAGYATAHFGKWHLGREPYDPLHQGFDFDIPHWYGPNPRTYIAPWRFSHFDKTPWPVRYDDGRPGENIEDRMGDEVAKFIRTHKDQPFFANCWCYSVHSPWESDPQLVEKYRKKADFKNPQHNPMMAAMIEVMDRNVGKVIRAIDESGLTERTIIVFFSDNGGIHYAEGKKFKGFENTPVTSNLPLRGGKETLYEGGTREPCVIIWPGVVKAGSTSEEVISGVDFCPTLVAAAKARVPKTHKFDGIDIRPALEGKKLDREAIYCHFPHYGGVPDEFAGTWVRKGDWKLILAYFDNPDRSDRFELYNLKDDMGETKNLADAMPDKVTELRLLLSQFLKDTEAVIPVLNPAYDAQAEEKVLKSRKAKLDAAVQAQAEGKW